jgi:hypothetical protein
MHENCIRKWIVFILKERLKNLRNGPNMGEIGLFCTNFGQNSWYQAKFKTRQKLAQGHLIFIGSTYREPLKTL